MIPGSGKSPGEGIGYPLHCSWASLVSAGKESACNAGDLGSIPELGRSPGEGKGYPLQYSGMENSICMQVKKQQLELDIEQEIGSKLGNEYIKAIYCQPAYGCRVHFSSVAQSCPTLCNPMNRSTLGLPVHHQLLEFTQTHVHRVSDAIQPSHPRLSPSPPAPNPSQHQSLESFPMSQLFA